MKIIIRSSEVTRHEIYPDRFFGCSRLFRLPKASTNFEGKGLFTNHQTNLQYNSLFTVYLMDGGYWLGYASIFSIHAEEFWSA